MSIEKEGVSGSFSSFYTNITTRYPTKMYNKSSNGTITKHQFLLDQMIATIEGTGTTAKKYFQHYDSLGGGNVETDTRNIGVKSLHFTF